jgi:hypothetical protein
LTEEETGKMILDSAFNVHSALGPGLLEGKEFFNKSPDISRIDFRNLSLPSRSSRDI